MTPVSIIGIPVYNGDQQYIEIYCQMYDSVIKLAPECFFLASSHLDATV